MQCPKCSYKQTGGLECMRCGVIFSKYQPPPATPQPAPTNDSLAEKKETEQNHTFVEADSHQVTSSKKQNTIVFGIGGVLVAAMAVYMYTSSGKTIEEEAPPTRSQKVGAYTLENPEDLQQRVQAASMMQQEAIKKVQQQRSDYELQRMKQREQKLEKQKSVHRADIVRLNNQIRDLRREKQTSSIKYRISSIESRIKQKQRQMDRANDELFELRAKLY